MRLPCVLFAPFFSETVLCVISKTIGTVSKPIDLPGKVSDKELLEWLIKHEILRGQPLDFSRAELDELQLLPFIYYLDHTTKRQMEQIWEILSTHEDSKLDSFLQELKQLAEHFSSAAQTPTKNSVPILSLNSLNDINVIWNAVERRTPKRKDSDDDGLNDSPLSDYNYTVSSSSNLDDNEELFPMDD